MSAASTITDSSQVETRVGQDLRCGTGLATLLTLPGIGEKRALLLAQTFSTWTGLIKATGEDLATCLGAKTAQALRPHLDAHPDRPDLDLPNDTQVVSILDETYPAALRGIPAPPTLLWVTGALPPPQDAAVTIVGTRTPDTFGHNAAHHAAASAAAHGLVTISGLALGVDTIAATTCMDAGLPTWAVLGQGVATLPGSGSRADLAARILETGGGLISEVPPHTPVATHLLTQRNRIQSGLSMLTFIAQTGLATPTKPAGALHTVKHALTQGRPIAVAQPPAGHNSSDVAGNLALTSPFGIDPTLLHLTDPGTAALVRTRTPLADHVITGPEDLTRLWTALI